MQSKIDTAQSGTDDNIPEAEVIGEYSPLLSPDELQELIDELGEQDKCNAAVIELKKSADPVVTRRLVKELITNTRFEIRIHLPRLLNGREGEEVTRALLHAVTRDKNDLVKARAIEALNGRENIHLLPILRQALEHTINDGITYEPAYEVGDPELDKQLLAYAAIKALEEIEGAEAEKELLLALAHSYRPVRKAAHFELRKRGKLSMIREMIRKTD